MEEFTLVGTNSFNTRQVSNQIEYAKFVVESSRIYSDLQDKNDKYKHLIELRDDLNNKIEELDDKMTCLEHEADFIRAMLRGHIDIYGENQENENDENLKKEVLNELGYEDGTIIR